MNDILINRLFNQCFKRQKKLMESDMDLKTAINAGRLGFPICLNESGKLQFEDEELINMCHELNDLCDYFHCEANACFNTVFLECSIFDTPKLNFEDLLNTNFQFLKKALAQHKGQPLSTAIILDCFEVNFVSIYNDIKHSVIAYNHQLDKNMETLKNSVVNYIINEHLNTEEYYKVVTLMSFLSNNKKVVPTSYHSESVDVVSKKVSSGLFLFDYELFKLITPGEFTTCEAEIIAGSKYLEGQMKYLTELFPDDYMTGYSRLLKTKVQKEQAKQKRIQGRNVPAYEIMGFDSSDNSFTDLILMNKIIVEDINNTYNNEITSKTTK